MMLRLASRILWFTTGISAAVACILYFIPFTYQQVIKARIFPDLNEAVKWLPIFGTLASILLSISILTEQKGHNGILDRRIRWTLLGLCAIVPAALAAAFEIGLPSGKPGWFLGVTALLITIAPLLSDVYWAITKYGFPESLGYRSPEFRDKDFHLFLCALLTSGALVSVSGDYGPIKFSGLFTSTLMVAMIFFAYITFVFRLAERTRQPLRNEWIFSAAAAGIYFYRCLSGGLFPAIAFVGMDQKVISLLIAAAVAIFLMALSTVVAKPSKDPVTGLQLFFSPFAPKATLVGIVAIAAIIAAELVLSARVALMDWNFIGQKAVLVVSFVLIFANLNQLLPIRSPKGFHRPYAFVAGLVVLAIYVNLQNQISEIESKNNVVLQVMKTALSSGQSLVSEGLFNFLQKNSNIPKSMKIDPVDMKLSREQKLTGKLEATPVKPMNIIMIVVDSLRPDYLGAYNQSVTFTPSIKEFSKDAIVFHKAFARYGATGLSEPSIWAGGMIIHQQYVSPFYPMNSLQKLLSAHKYKQFVSMDSILSQVVERTPLLTDLDPGVSTQDLDLCATLPKLHDHLLQHRNEGPIFAYTQPQNIHISVLNRNPANRNAGQENGFYKPYADGLKRIDACFGTFISQLKTDGLYDDTLIVLSADHGDSLGEEGRFGHAYTIYPEVMKIPIIIHLPVNLRGQWEWDASQLAFSVDITPSLYALLGHQTLDESWMYGRPLFWPKGQKPERKNFNPYLLASSYGAVYGLLDGEGSDLYIVDGVNLTDSYFDLRSVPPTLIELTGEARAQKEKIIRSRIADIDNLYGFRGVQ